MFERSEIFFDTAAPSFALVLRNIEWRYLGTCFVVLISPWIGRYLSVTWMDAHLEIFILFFRDGVRISVL
jgi:hypothetical protein